MRGQVLTAAAVLVSLAVLPVGLSVNPLDDDAGTGGDASDFFVLPTMIEPGSHSGRLTNPHDLVDAYGFMASTGEVLRMSVEFPWDAHPEILLYAPDQTFAFVLREGTNSLVLNQDGVWTFEFSIASEASPHEVAYTFAFNTRVLPHTIVLEEDANWSIFENRFDEPMEMYITAIARQGLERWPSEARGYLFASHYESETETGMSSGQSMKLSSSFDFGNKVHVSALPAPPVEVPSLAEIPMNYGLAGFVFAKEAIRGHSRISVLATDHGSNVSIVVASSGPFEWAVERGDEGVHQWSTLNADSDDQLIVPGFAFVGPRSYSFEAGSRFVGWFHAHDSQGHAIAPDGSRFDPCPDLINSVTYHHPATQGEWNLHVEESQDMGLFADRLYFLGYDFPELGLVPPVKHPYPEERPCHQDVVT